MHKALRQQALSAAVQIPVLKSWWQELTVARSSHCDGTYKVENFKPGRYSIVEGDRHHAVRKRIYRYGSGLACGFRRSHYEFNPRV
jgi:hypothetical protein